MRPTARTTRPLPGTTYDPFYPDEDGRPMGDTLFHSRALAHLYEALEDFFRNDPRVLIAMNLLFYFQQGNPRGRRDPDILVARGVGNHIRRSYRLWEEGVLPCTLFEIASKKTWRQDVGPKRRLYARLGIPEYFIFDPEAIYVQPVLRGFRPRNGRSVQITPEADGSFFSEQLGLRLNHEGSLLRLYDLHTGQLIPSRGERAELERERAEQQRQEAELARQEAETERRRADALAAELARLRAEQPRSGRKSRRGSAGEST